MAQEAPRGSGRAITSMSHGAYPGFVHKDIRFKYYPYREDPMHLECLVADDMTDLVLEHAPDISETLEHYAHMHGVDFQFIYSQLTESEQILFNIRFGFEEEHEEPDPCDFEYAKKSKDLTSCTKSLSIKGP